MQIIITINKTGRLSKTVLLTLKVQSSCTTLYFIAVWPNTRAFIGAHCSDVARDNFLERKTPSSSRAGALFAPGTSHDTAQVPVLRQRPAEAKRKNFFVTFRPGSLDAEGLGL